MNNSPKIRYDAIFSKKGDMVFISHLDLMTLFKRAMRRAELPFVLTEGFTKRVKISLPKALKLGVESEREELALYLTEDKDPAFVMEAMNKELPEGVKILEINRQQK
jgi:radical SAM-linked protein